MVWILQPGFYQTNISKEFNKKTSIEWFDYRKEQVIHNIDTLYYSIEVKNNWKDDIAVNLFKDYLESIYIKALEGDLVELSELGNDLVCKGVGFNIYRYDLNVENFFTAFIAVTVPNEKTPPIFVQIRSEYLWQFGEEIAFLNSYRILKEVLSKYAIEVKEVKINRLDFAYHTNLIQNPLRFFAEEKLGEMQVSRFTRWHKEGIFIGSKTECDYITLGRRKSNNVFLRIYLKNQEVCNMGYKQFFIDLWYQYNLISKYDKTVLEWCFEKGSYKYIDKARLKFYFKYGSCKYYKDNIYNILEDLEKWEPEDIRLLADKLTPPVTKVLNIEFQTKRKFLSSIKFEGDKKEYFDHAKDLCQVIFNKNKVHRILTNDVIRFVKFQQKRSRKRKKDTATWWSIIQNCKLNKHIDDKDIKVYREYQKCLDIERIRKAMISKIATYSIYTKSENEDKFIDDVSGFLSYINENDLQKYIDGKSKKAKLLKNRLNKTMFTNYNDKYKVIFIDMETGELVNQ